MAWKIRVADGARTEGDSIRSDALAVRETVFVEGQGVPADLEVDEYDETAIHFAAYADGEPIGAARLRALDAETGKVERVAVLASHRGKGLGTAIVDRLETVARERGLERLTMHSQLHAADFYERLGYERVGEAFEEAGIPHVEMRKDL